MRLLVSYSGGKDSTLALYRALQQGHEVVAVMTTSSGKTQSWFHDINLDLLNYMAKQMSVSFEPVTCGAMNAYTDDFEQAVLQFKDKYQLEGIVFGDIDLQAHRDWCEQRCANCGLKALFPLWKEERREVVDEFINLGFKTIIKRVTKGQLTPNYLGKVLDTTLVDDFVLQGIDACGENGEYHTLVYDGPIFKQPVPIKLQAIIEHENSYSIEVVLDEK